MVTDILLKDEFPAELKYLLRVTSKCSVTSTVKAGKMTCFLPEVLSNVFIPQNSFSPLYSSFQTDILSVAK